VKSTTDSFLWYFFLQVRKRIFTQKFDMQTTSHLTIIYAESTPNPAALKFVSNRPLIEGSPIEFTSKEQTKSSPLAAKLFSFPFVTNIFIAGNFITITKASTVEWHDIQTELREFLQNYLSQNLPILSEKIVTEKASIVASEDVTGDKPTNETDIKIAEILEEYIRPAVENDGGAITFKSFKNGVVTVVLQGSCSGCPSATFTLKAGIEGLLKRLLPEVTEVVAEEM
jgi:Fe-S cluster biogenesis protein NfuA